jgi:hypothetical protein
MITPVPADKFAGRPAAVKWGPGLRARGNSSRARTWRLTKGQPPSRCVTLLTESRTHRRPSTGPYGARGHRPVVPLCRQCSTRSPRRRPRANPLFPNRRLPRPMPLPAHPGLTRPGPLLVSPGDPASGAPSSPCDPIDPCLATTQDRKRPSCRRRRWRARPPRLLCVPWTSRIVRGPTGERNRAAPLP